MKRLLVPLRQSSSKLRGPTSIEAMPMSRGASAGSHWGKLTTGICSRTFGNPGRSRKDHKIFAQALASSNHPR